MLIIIIPNKNIFYNNKKVNQKVVIIINRWDNRNILPI